MNNKYVLIYGYGKSGKSVENYLMLHDIEYMIYDKNKKLVGKEDYIKPNKKNILCFDLIVVSPAVSIEEPILKFAKTNNIKVISELEFGYINFKKQPNIISVTGTNGKTTTTLLINHILNELNISSLAVGNIGIPITNVVDDGYKNLVCEVSSFQLEGIEKYSSKVNIFLNISFDHLDRHISYYNYLKAKCNIFKNNNKNTINIVNLDCDTDLNIIELIGKTITFSTSNSKADIYIENNKIISKIKGEKEVCELNQIKLPLIFKETILAVFSYFIYNDYNIETVIKHINSFEIMSNRYEFVTEYNNKVYINDSKATNIHAVNNSIINTNSNILLMLGGKNKGLNFNEFFKNLPANVIEVVCFGADGLSIFKSASKFGNVKCSYYKKLINAINYVVDCEFKGTVLFAPACASFDEFNNYAERGEFFKKTIMLKLGNNE